jgi:threonine aldolase
LAQIPGIVVEAAETNLVFFDTTGAGLTADELASRLRKQGVMLSTMGRYRARACTHLDVDLAGVEMAVQVIRDAVAVGA